MDVDDPIYVRIAETCRPISTLSGIRVKIVQRESAAAREAARKGADGSVLKDWYADYPDAENFLYPLLHSANKGVGGNVSFYSERAVRLARDRCRAASPTRRSASRSTRRPTQIAFRDAPMIFLWFYSELYAVQPWISGFHAAGDLQRAAAGRR